MTRVLLIATPTPGLERHLAQAGMVHDLVDSSEEIELADLDYDAIVFDLALGGVEIVRRLRSAGHRVPIIALTQGDKFRDRVDALDAGCDDVLALPFFLAELVARIRAVTRRNWTAGLVTNIVTVGPMTIYLDRQQVDIDGRPVFPGLSTKQFQLLAVLAQNKGRVISKASLCSRLWSSDAEPSDPKIIDVMLHNIRKKLGAARQYLITVHGTGHAVDDTPRPRPGLARAA